VKTVQVVLEEELLKAVDRAARKAGMNRSAFLREAAREHLRRRRREDLEARDRAGYERFPSVEFDVWDKVAAWPED
jgi:metal-responsive CopG/Arc/MetJ family transcriptional regulator